MIWFLNLFMISFFNDFQQFSRSFIGWFMFKALTASRPTAREPDWVPPCIALGAAPKDVFKGGPHLDQPSLSSLL